ncbi:MAG: DUF4398 domain-containing protein [Proteobacteria bacterium]|nr:MAG: DUF4398 domain-containing protein [Pseudomonadota bacterium]
MTNDMTLSTPRKQRRFLLYFILPLAFVCGFGTGCVTHIPVDEYTMARAAYEAAKDSDAARFAPSLWFNAEQAYREAQKDFRDRHYEQAAIRFVQAQDLSEQAENSARLSRNQSGEVIP